MESRKGAGGEGTLSRSPRNWKNGRSREVYELEPSQYSYSFLSFSSLSLCLSLCHLLFSCPFPPMRKYLACHSLTAIIERNERTWQDVLAKCHRFQSRAKGVLFLVRRNWFPWSWRERARKRRRRYRRAEGLERSWVACLWHDGAVIRIDSG